MDKILIPCDFSEQATNAFRLAIDLAHANGAEVHVLHVIELPVMHDDVLTPMPTFDETLLKELTTGAEEKFAALKKDFGKEHLFLKTKIEFGPIVPLIIDYGKDNGISLIVMGTKGASGLKEIFVGSVAGAVLGVTQRAVLRVQQRTVHRGVDGVTAALQVTLERPADRFFIIHNEQMRLALIYFQI